MTFHSYFQEALRRISGLNLSPRKQAIFYFYYGDFFEYCAKVESEQTEQQSKWTDPLQNALEYYQRAFDLNPQAPSIVHKIGTICRLLWSKEDNHETRLKSVMEQEKQWIECNTPCRHSRRRTIIPPTQLVSRNVIPPPFKMVSFRKLLNDYNFKTQNVENPYLIKSLNMYETANYYSRT